MTTIAADADAGVMCSDSGWSDGDQRGAIRKVHRVRGDLVGLSGDIDASQQWLADHRAKREPSPKLIVTALRLSGGAIYTWTAGGWCKHDERQLAIGSGAMAARAAMMSGKSCREAVAIATKIDAGSFGPVRSYRV